MSVNGISVIKHPISLCSIYAHADISLYQELEKHLSPLKRDGLISLWSIDKVAPGNEHALESEQHLKTAQIILLLMSADFFADERCHQMMMQSLQRFETERVSVLPILLRPFDWKMVPIGTLPILPSNGRPVTIWGDRDDAFSRIASKIRALVLAQLDLPMEARVLTEDEFLYLDWLVKRTSFLDTRGISLPQRPFQIGLEAIYIGLNAHYYDDVLQGQEPSHSPDTLTTKPSQQTQSFPLCDVVARHDHLLLLGEPGSGKTTFLHYLALKHAQAFCKHKDTEFGKAHFPILLRIADYVEYGMHQGKSLREYLASDYIRRHECPVSEDVLSANLQVGTCLVLFDGLDEIVHAHDRRGVVQRLEEFVRYYEDSSNRFVITSRHAGYREAPLNDTFARFTLRAMDETHIWHFLEVWCPAVEIALSSNEMKTIQIKQAKDEVESLKDAIQAVSGVCRLATNPLFLRILVQLHRTGQPLPQRRVELYNQITNTLTQTWRSPQRIPGQSGISSFDQSTLTHLLSKLAYWLHLKKPGGSASEREIWRVLGKEWACLMNRHWEEEDPHNKEDVKRFLQTMRDHTGILVEDASHQYRFAHHTFEEYYAAHALIASSQQYAQRIRRHLHDPRWQEPILLALGLLGIESPDEACILVETAILAEGEEARANALEPDSYEPLLGRDFLFALRCIGDDIPVHVKRAEQLIERLLREITQWTGVGRFQKYQEALAEGLKYVETSTYAHRMIPYLIKNMEKPDPGIRLWSLYSLGRIGRMSEAEKIRPLLLDTLRDEDSRIRSAALWGLSAMSGLEITKVLLFVLSNDTDASMRKDAAEYLGQRHESSPQITQALLAVLHNKAMSDILLRDAAVESLGQLGDASPPVISSLVALLNREILLLPDKSVLKSLHQLSQSSSEVVPMMVDALQNAAPRVRIAVANAIETFGHASPEAIATLCNVPSQRSSIRALHAPFCIKKQHWLPHQIEALCLYKLRNSYAPTRWEAVKKLGQLNEISERAEGALVAALFDEDASVRSQAVQSLSLFEMSSEVLRTFIHVLSNDANLNVRASIVECFGEIDQPSEEIVQALLKAVYDPEEYVRTCAVKSLGYRVPPSPEILTMLLSVLLNDAFFGARWEIVKGFIHRKDLPIRVVPAIVSGLSEDKHAAVRSDCAHLLGQEGFTDTSIIEALLKGLSDTDILVRKACSQALVQLGQRFPQEREAIMVQLAHLIQEQRDDSVGYYAPCVVTYDAFWLLAHDDLLEP